MKTTTLPLRNLMNRSPLRAFLLIPLVLACFALSPQARAACEEGCDTNFNSFLGEGVLSGNTTGFFNVGVGFEALFNNTTGFKNTAIGAAALSANTTGKNNTALGFVALELNTTASNNTALGFGALGVNTTGNSNTATGFEALLHSSTGSNNTANGFSALRNNTTGIFNTANGANALLHNTTANFNVAIGENALISDTTGGGNIALGAEAGLNLTTGNNNIDIGNAGVAGESNHIRIGTGGTHTATFIAGISGVAVNGSQVVVNSDGKLGVTASSARFKDEIKSMEKASEAILALKPVTFHYKKELDPDGMPQFGLVAEDVEKVNPNLVARDDQGKPYTVRYEAVNAMLLNEFLKEHWRVGTLEATVARQQSINAEQQKEIQALTASLKEQAVQIQKVSAQLEVTNPARRMVNNH